eukprot:TRINITY_DN8946_c0_g1_i1.p1 TRINITY_DN8946_c0_g1~~TRINITY_DN8946_c0_g1_i1.p1  ORF type:complete len:381 (+),score=94.17 TRINITY_DN8946_c0_g1_i1:41-1183(+)
MTRLPSLLLLGLVVGLAGETYAQTCTPTIDFTSEDGVLKLNGNRFYMKGINWFGFETETNNLHGLWSVTMASLLDFTQRNGFNFLRIPFHLELFTQNKSPQGLGPNSDLNGLSALQVLDKVINEAGKRGIFIMLDLHSFTPDNFMTENMWYSSQYPESAVLSMWDRVIQRYANTWNVVALDLKNEPYGTTWNTNNPSTDWNAAAARIANYIHNNGGSKFLIMVEGTSSSPPCADACFWGENFQGVHQAPVAVTLKKKLVYSPHTYGPGVSAQAYFSAGNYPLNMNSIWETHFGFLPTKTGNAIVLGEWGGKYDEQPRTKMWMDQLVSYLIAKGSTDQFFWCLNPNSGDTGECACQCHRTCRSSGRWWWTCRHPRDQSRQC